MGKAIIGAADLAKYVKPMTREGEMGWRAPARFLWIMCFQDNGRRAKDCLRANRDWAGRCLFIKRSNGKCGWEGL